MGSQSGVWARREGQAQSRVIGRANGAAEPRHALVRLTNTDAAVAVGGPVVRFTSMPKFCPLILAMAVGLSAAGHAQDAPADSQKVEPPPVPDHGTTLQLKCINENTSYTTSGKRAFY